MLANKSIPATAGGFLVAPLVLAHVLGCSDQGVDEKAGSSKEHLEAPGHFGSAARFRVATPEDPDEFCTERAISLARAAGNDQLRESDLLHQENLDSLGYISNALRVACMKNGSWVVYVDTSRFARFSPEETSAPSRELIAPVIDSALNTLEEDGVLPKAELDETAATYSTTTAGGGEGAGEPEEGPFEVQTTVRVPRRLGGLRVEGNWVAITVDNSLRVTAIRVRWRPTEPDGQVSLTRSQKTADLDFAQLASQPGLTRSTLRKGLSYVDAGVKANYTHLEPWYFYLHRDTGSQAAGRKQRFVSRAIDAPLQQLEL